MILKDELSQIVQAEQETSKQVDLAVQQIAQEKMVLEKELYEQLKQHKNALHEQLQLDISTIKVDINSKLNQQLTAAHQYIAQEYEKLQAGSLDVEQLLVDFLWKQ